MSLDAGFLDSQSANQSHSCANMESVEHPHRKIRRGVGRPGWLAASLLAFSLAVAGAEPALRVELLAPRSGPRGATLFTELGPDQTDIVTENNYSDPKMWGERYQEFALGAMGTGLAAGDYDGDGKADLFVVSKTGVCRLFRNLGGWKFEDVTGKAGLAPAETSVLDQGLAWLKSAVGRDKSSDQSVDAWRQGAAFADVNDDGWLDLYVCRFNAPNLLYINRGDGTFREEAAARGLAVVDASGMGSFCDYDADGWLDVYVTTNMLDAGRSPSGQVGLLFHNNGDGTFADVTARAGIGGETLTHSALWWDYDEDGRPDLYTANDFGGADQLYRNNGDGTFTDVINEVVPRTTYSSMGADLGDVDNNGRIDLFVAEMAASTHEMDQRGMASSRELTREDDDNPAVAQQFPINALYLNTGTGRMQEGARLAGLGATDWTWSVRFEDLDEDGRLDLHVTNGMNREYQNADLRQRIIRAENLAERMRIMRESPELLEKNLVFRNLGNLRFEESGASWGLNQRGISFGAAFADFDGDGDLDLVFANYEKSVTVLRNDNDRGHRLIVALRGTHANRFGVGATVKLESALGVQVRQLVLARGYMSTNEPVLHFGLGEDSVITRLTVIWPGGGQQSFTDLPVDRRLTITEDSAPVAAKPSPARQFAEVSASIGLSLNVREGAEREAGLQPLQPLGFNRRGPGLAVADINGDGRDDVLLGGTRVDPARLLVAGSTGFAVAETMPPSRVADGPVLLFDADNNGTSDILLSGGGAGMPRGVPDYQPRLFFNSRGALQAAATALPPVPISVGAAAAADFDRDGRLDVFLGGRVEPGRYPLAPQSALLANRGGQFEDVTDDALRRVGMVSSALWSDVDVDGWPDLLLALDWGPVKCFHNDQGLGFTDWTERLGFAAGGNGWWTSLATADFNGDGRPDYAAGNLGLNTQYHASAQAPALLFHGAFTPGGAPKLVEAYYESGKLYPWRTLKALGSAIPPLLRRFPRNDVYASATLEEVFGPEKLAAARRFIATEFQSGVFLSQPDGTYSFYPLPRIAQIAPFQGLVAGDFDGDGCADLYAVQNSHAPASVVGRFEGGLSQLLRGDGRGGFTAVPAIESGLIVPGDAKALVVLDLDQDGWPDFLMTRNNGTTLAWRNGGVRGRQSICVRLKGTPANPSAIGARLKLELADGSAQTAEIQAGGGYYSQSTPAAFFGGSVENPPQRVHVRWPDGSSSTADVPPQSSTITISQ